MKAPRRLYTTIRLSVTIATAALFILTIFPVHYSPDVTAQSQTTQTSPEGAALYKQRCAMCHDNAADRIPPLFLIRRRSAEDVMQTLTDGSMKQQASGLNPDQIRALAVFLTGKLPGAPMGNLNVNLCKAPAEPINMKGPQWNGWGRDQDNSRFQPTPGIRAEDAPKLKVKWAFAHPGAMATGQPTIIGDRLFLTIEAGLIYSLNAQTGCTYWTAKTGAAVRAAITVAAMPAAPSKYAVFFGDEKSNVQALDAATGKPLWKTKVDDHFLARITGAPVVHAGRIYAPVSSFEETAGRDNKYECCTFRGSVVALDAATGKVVWKTYAVADAPKPFKKNSAGTQMHGPAGGAIWSAPTIDARRGVLYVGTGNSYTDVETNSTDAVMAMDLATGKVKWTSQVTPKDNFLVGCRQPGTGNCPNEAGPDYDFGASVILRALPGGKQIILAGQKSGVMYGLDPDNNGKKLWETKLGNGGALGGIEWGIAADRESVYVPMADVGGAPDKRQPGLSALKIATGEKLWHTPAPPAKCAWGATRCNNAQSAAATAIPGLVFSGTADGRLRAYAAKDGAVLWEFDTAAMEYDAVNGAKARGGTLDGAGPTIANGVLYVNSGYGRLIGQPGNLLLAFSVEGK
ncbi:MAG: PQQ-binding-like beta-propeller repeat protein [Blastocatellia bacterium]